MSWPRTFVAANPTAMHGSDRKINHCGPRQTCRTGRARPRPLVNSASPLHTRFRTDTVLSVARRGLSARASGRPGLDRTPSPGARAVLPRAVEPASLVVGVWRTGPGASAGPPPSAPRLLPSQSVTWEPGCCPTGEIRVSRIHAQPGGSLTPPWLPPTRGCRGGWWRPQQG